VITQGTGSPYTYMGCSSEAGKTGTSEELSDAWFVGFTPLFSTAVWVGHPTSREYTGFGGPTAGPIWANYMSEAVEGDCPEFETPSSLPELEGLDSEHTSSSGYNSYEEEESFEGEEEESEDSKGKGKGGDEGGQENTPEPEPTPEPTPTPTPTPTPAPPAGGGISPG
jgi:membrane carboxypeptidase/penicillin-binding protein